MLTSATALPTYPTTIARCSRTSTSSTSSSTSSSWQIWRFRDDVVRFAPSKQEPFFQHYTETMNAKSATRSNTHHTGAQRNKNMVFEIILLLVIRRAFSACNDTMQCDPSLLCVNSTCVANCTSDSQCIVGHHMNLLICENTICEHKHLWPIHWRDATMMLCCLVGGAIAAGEIAVLTAVCCRELLAAVCFRWRSWWWWSGCAGVDSRWWI
jgi:hypothetical protein